MLAGIKTQVSFKQEPLQKDLQRKDRCVCCICKEMMTSGNQRPGVTENLLPCFSQISLYLERCVTLLVPGRVSKIHSRTVSCLES